MGRVNLNTKALASWMSDLHSQTCWACHTNVVGKLVPALGPPFRSIFVARLPHAALSGSVSKRHVRGRAVFWTAGTEASAQQFTIFAFKAHALSFVYLKSRNEQYNSYYLREEPAQRDQRVIRLLRSIV